MALAGASIKLLALALVHGSGTGSGLLLLEVGVRAKAALVGGGVQSLHPWKLWSPSACKRRRPDPLALTSAIFNLERACKRCRLLAVGRSGCCCGGDDAMQWLSGGCNSADGAYDRDGGRIGRTRHLPR